MFIEIKDYLIPVDIICYIKRIGQGLRIVTKAGAIDIATYSDEDYEFLKLKLCGETWKPEDALTTVEEVEPMKLCNRKSCESCEHIQTIENPIDFTEPHIFICKMMRKEVLDNNTSLPTPYEFYKSEYHYKEEK